jgi:hypothetical protein
MLGSNPSDEATEKVDSSAKELSLKEELFVAKYGILVERVKECSFEVQAQIASVSHLKRPKERSIPRWALRSPVGTVYNCIYDKNVSPEENFFGSDAG